MLSNIVIMSILRENILFDKAYVYNDEELTQKLIKYLKSTNQKTKKNYEVK